MPIETEDDYTFQENIISAFNLACKHIKGDCPRVIMDVQPWDCDIMCNKIKDDSWKCWKQYFINETINK
jgi:hypothetical protein